MARRARGASSVQARAWQRMLSGRRLDLLDPSPLDVEIEDIAHGLSRVARWNGQTTGPWAYNVAQHSLLVEDLVGRFRPKAPRAWRLPAQPPKSAAQLIKRADRAAAYLEATQLAGFSSLEAHRFFGRPRGLDDLRLEAWPPPDAKDRFLARFAELTAGV